ncbi:conserved hypothetical protein [Candidatus Brocadia pituitae]|nr:conserved hypothetical protein [Candidatus Brocadia pituitae]
MVTALKTKLKGSGWKLITYHWEKEEFGANTGPVTKDKSDFFGYGNATEAAVYAELQGTNLFTLLKNQAPGLLRVHFIAHSAGSWAAREAMELLLNANPNVVCQMTLLDPFIPDHSKLVKTETGLDNKKMSATKGLPGNSRIQQLENYYADDFFSACTVFGTISTPGEPFTWRTNDLNLQVDWGVVLDFFGIPIPGLSAWYDCHSGPIQFYADTINSADSYLSSGGLENGDFDLNNIGWKKSIFYKEQQLRATITGIYPPTLQTSSSPQPITIYGSNFLPSNDPNASTLIFYDPENNSYPRTPTYINSGELRYNITVQSATGTWKVKVVNGTVESLPFSFTVTSSSVQLTGLSISGPTAIAENSSGQFTATAYFSDGSSSMVTSSTSWSENSSATNFPSPGLLTAGSVSSDTLVTVSASYTAGSITRPANANVMIVNTGGGGTQEQELIFNGGFEFGKIIWSANTLSGGASESADIVQLSYPRPGGTWYAYVGDRTPTSSNALGSLHQRIHIPANATSIVLNFYLNVKTEETTVGPYDKMDVNLRNASDVLIKKLRTFSEADKGANTSGIYSLVTIDMTADLAAYKDQDVILQFYVDTNSAKYTIFRIDDVSVQAVVPLPVTLSSLAIKGPSSVTEGNTAQYFATAVFSDGSMREVSPNTWDETSSATTISSSGQLMAGQVGADTTVTLYASYTYSGVTREAYKDVTVINQSATFSYLAISGPSSMNENSSGQFTATAIFSDGSSQVVTPSWSENSTATRISNGGLLTADDVVSDTTVTVSAIHTIGSITQNASQNVLIVNIPTPPTLISLVINGASSVNENSTAQYSATAFFSDGTSQTVTPTWSEDSAVTTISISDFGLFSAGEVTSDTSVTVSASYMTGGITKNAQKSVTVINTNINPDDVTATIYSISPNPATQGTTVNFDGTGTDSLGHSITAYSWRSSVDGIIGTSASFGKDNLSAGSHSIYFKVQCSDDTWSFEIPWSGNPLMINSNCTPTISSTSQSFSSNGGSDKVDVTASSSSCSWTATSNAGWITITSGSSGTGSGTVSYSVSAYTGTSTRTGTMTIEELIFTVTQSGPTPIPTVTPTPTPTRIIRLEGDLNFAEVQIGGSVQRTMTIYNDGNSTLTVDSISYPPGFSGNWRGTIGAESSQPVPVTFSPTDQKTYSGNVTVTSDATSGTNTKSVTGTGTIKPISTLTVASSNPNSGVPITVSPNDNNGLGNDATQFTRTYNNNTSVTLTAPLTAEGNSFQKWQRNGVDLTTSQTANVTMNANYTMMAVYTTFSTPIPTPTPGATGNIAGQVTDSITGAGINGATVTLDTGESATSGSVQGQDGVYSIAGISVGQHTITASASNFATSSQTVIVVEGKPNPQTGKNIFNFALTSTVIPTPTPTPTCKAANLDAKPEPLKLLRGRSADETVTVTCGNGEPKAGILVTATVRNGKKRISVSPSSAVTDTNGQAMFTITAREKTGNAKVSFNAADGLRDNVPVKVRK